MTDTKRTLTVTKGNLSHSHLYVNGHFDFFPKDAFGPAKRARNEPGTIEIIFDGLNQSVVTDIARDAKSGRPRNFLRCRSWVGRFYKYHKIKPGTELSLERLAEHKYRLSVPSPPRPRAVEFFTGIGLVRLALESQGWDIVFANDIDTDKAEMYRHNWPNDDHLHVGDIHEIRAADIPPCELFTASFPCNDLSIAGQSAFLGIRQASLA